MPWVNWHAGPDHEIIDKLAVTTYPTYTLIDSNGKIAMKYHRFGKQSAELVKMLLKVICGGK